VTEAMLPKFGLPTFGRSTGLTAGAPTSVGSLPHTDAGAAADFVLTHHPALPAIPSLPRRSPFEGMVAQAAVGIPGVYVQPDGSILLNPRRIDPVAPITTDLDHEAFGGLRVFLEVARGRTEPVKWQLTGPITLGLALMHAGAPANLAFDIATRAVRVRIRALHRAVSEALPEATQVVIVDEPCMAQVLRRGFPLPPDIAIDLLSGVLAGIEISTTAGVHCCGNVDAAVLTAVGPGVLSIPADRSLLAAVGYLVEFLAHGGWIAWGAVPTDRPLRHSPERYWSDLVSLWCELVALGVDPILLRTRALVTPVCGLAHHDPAQAAIVLDHVSRVAAKVAEQASATRLSIGA
jgi:methionine synthase II (cobalamin-independent)